MGNALSHVLIPVRANLENGISGIVSSHGLIGSVGEARVIDVVLHLIRAQGRVKPAHDHAAKFDGVESEADRFNQFWSDVVTELNTAAFIANSFQNGIMHDVFAPEKLMYIEDGPIVSNRKDHPSEALQ